MRPSNFLADDAFCLTIVRQLSSLYYALVLLLVDGKCDKNQVDDQGMIAMGGLRVRSQVCRSGWGEKCLGC